jgi:hypothetical protein
MEEDAERQSRDITADLMSKSRNQLNESLACVFHSRIPCVGCISNRPMHLVHMKCIIIIYSRLANQRVCVCVCVCVCDFVRHVSSVSLEDDRPAFIKNSKCMCGIQNSVWTDSVGVPRHRDA